VISSVSLEAERELTQGAVFYAREANADLGLAFIAEFERSLGVLCENPRLGAAWRGSIRRFPLQRFPYSIIYQIMPNEVRVIALAHQSRRPGYWRGRQ
jgi:plasmid stabilization system protein ParE